MKAIVQNHYGSPDDQELREVDKPAVGDDEVLVRVRAASVHPDVWHFVTGRLYVLRLMGAGFSKPRNPIPGTDMAGIVESVGRNVTQFRQGDAVFGETIRTHQWATGGAFAEYVSVRQEWLALKPDNIIFDVPGNHPFSACKRALKPNGKYVLIGHENFGASGERVFGLFPRFLKLIFLSFFVKQLRLGRSSLPSRKEAMATLRELLEAGKITPIIDSTYPLSEAREAFRHMIGDEPRGKVIITP
jgi:NADPH:quinone reductase-like Zn-dependent oxidoreductase